MNKGPEASRPIKPAVKTMTTNGALAGKVALVTGKLLATAALTLVGYGTAEAHETPASRPPNHPAKPGPYAITIEADPSLPTHTIYRPADLSTFRGDLPIVAWGNGACSNAIEAS
jgi:hypothetical protein